MYLRDTNFYLFSALIYPVQTKGEPEPISGYLRLQTISSFRIFGRKVKPKTFSPLLDNALMFQVIPNWVGLFLMHDLSCSLPFQI